LSKGRNERAVVTLVAMRSGKIDGGRCERGFDALQLGFEALSISLGRRRLCGGSIFRRRLPIRISLSRKRNNRSSAGTKLLACLPQCIGPAPVFWRQGDEDLALVVSCHVLQKQRALPFIRAPLTESEKATEAAIGSAVGGQAEQAWRILQVEAGADDQLQSGFLRSRVRPHDTGERIAIRYGERGKAKRLGLGDQRVRMGAAPQEREVRRNLQLGIGGRGGHGQLSSPEQSVHVPDRRPGLGIA